MGVSGRGPSSSQPSTVVATLSRVEPVRLGGMFGFRKMQPQPPPGSIAAQPGFGVWQRRPWGGWFDVRG